MKSILLSLLFIAALAAAQDDRKTDDLNKFTNPPPAGRKLATDPTVYYTNPSYVLGYSIPFEWTTNVSEINLILVKEGAGSNTWTLGSALRTQYLYWNGTTPSKEDLDLKPRDTFWLGAWDANEAGGTPVFFSHYFNFTVETTSTKSTTSTSATSASSSITSEVSVTASTTSLSTGSNVPVVSEVPTEKTSNNTAIGAGVGGGVGGAILILGLVGFLLYRRQQTKAQSGQGTSIHYNDMQQAPFSLQAPPNEPAKELYSGVPTQQQQYYDPPKPEGRAQLP